MLDSLLTIILSSAILLGAIIPYVRRKRATEAKARLRFEELKGMGLHETVTMHPHINAAVCIGCGGCVNACPEGEVLGIINGKASIIYGSKCVGHGLCVTACPVGAIELLMAKPGRSAQLPQLDLHLQSSVPGIFIIGELGGLGLIRNAVEQGTSVIHYLSTLPSAGTLHYDVAIVGAGPGGMTAALAAKEKGMKYIVLEQGDIGGAILHYPKEKVVTTSPIELPLWGKIQLDDLPKVELVKIWQTIVQQSCLDIRVNEQVVNIEPLEDGGFTLTTMQNTITAQRIVLALGRRGTPRKLNIPGEEMPKVMYRLIDASSFNNKDILVVGGGDTAVETAVGLSMQKNNRVTLSYRKSSFTRISGKNAENLKKYADGHSLHIVLNSEAHHIFPDRVLLATADGERTVTNDLVFVCSGGEMPLPFLNKIGVTLTNQQI